MAGDQIADNNFAYIIIMTNVTQVYVNQNGKRCEGAPLYHPIDPKYAGVRTVSTIFGSSSLTRDYIAALLKLSTLCGCESCDVCLY